MRPAQAAALVDDAVDHADANPPIAPSEMAIRGYALVAAGNVGVNGFADMGVLVSGPRLESTSPHPNPFEVCLEIGDIDVVPTTGALKLHSDRGCDREFIWDTSNVTWNGSTYVLAPRADELGQSTSLWSSSSNPICYGVPSAGSASFTFDRSANMSGTIALDDNVGACSGQSYDATLSGRQILFTDVPLSSPFLNAIGWLSMVGLTDGFADGSFHPTDPVSRQAVAAYFHRWSGSPIGPFPSPGFSDVPANHLFRTPIAWGVQAGRIGGFEDGTFRPLLPVSRQAMVAFLYRDAGGPPSPVCNPTLFSDVGPGNPFCGQITWAAGLGLVSGFGDGRFGPTVAVSRQASAAILAGYADTVRPPA